MKILYIIPTYKPSTRYGGTTEVASHLAESLQKKGHEVTVYTTNGNGPDNLDIPTGRPVTVDGVTVFFFRRYTGDHSHICPGLWLKVLLCARTFDVVHLHSWWSPSIVIAAGICKLIGIRPVLSPHGMFCDHVLRTNNRMKKKILHFFSRPFLKNTWLHVSTEMEWQESQSFLRSSWPGITLPNPVRVSTPAEPGPRGSGQVFTIGFLSRIDPKKGLDLLIRALAAVSFDFRLKIAGSGPEPYLASLKQLAARCCIADRIEWVGPKYHGEKFRFLRDLDLFALTSRNENFAVVVIESLSAGTPVLVSREVGLAPYVRKNDLGWVTGIGDPGEIVSALERARAAADKRDRIRTAAPGIVSGDFDGEAIIDRYSRFYANLIRHGKPVLPMTT